MGISFCNKLLKVNEKTAKICVFIGPFGCGCGSSSLKLKCSNCGADSSGSVLLKVKKKGDKSGTVLVTYSLFDYDDSGKSCFFIDSSLYNLPKARYVGEVYVGSSLCGTIELMVSSDCKLAYPSVVNFDKIPCVGNDPSPVCPEEECL